MNGSVTDVCRAFLVVSAALAGFVAVQAVWAQPTRATAPPSPETEGIIFERQQVMLQLEKDSGTLGEIAAGLQKPDKLTETAQAIARGAKDALASFEPNVPGGRSKPEVWSNRADFRQRMESFAANADKMSKIAESGNLTGVVEVMAEALPCKQCHDIYRAPKRPAT